MIRIKRTTLLISFILLIFSCHQMQAQSIDVERAYALYYSKDYATCIQEVKTLINSSESYSAKNVEDIIYCGILCCQELMTQLNYDFSNKMDKAILEKQQEVWDTEVDFMIRLEAKCNYHLESDKSLESQHHYLSLKIAVYSILVSETDIDEYQKDLKSLHKQYKKEIFPKLNKSSMNSADILYGYSIIMNSLALEGDTRGMLDCMLKTIEPWFYSSVVLNNTLQRSEKINVFSSYCNLINLMNNGLEDEFAPTNDYISGLMDLNVRSKNISYYLKGNKMYETHLRDNWHQIQKTLKEREIAIEFCNAKGSDEHLFAFIIDNKCKIPRLEYSGHSYRAKNDIFGFSHLLQRSGIKECHNIYYSTTEEMAFIDMGYNNIAHKLHSISELLMPATKFVADPVVYTFADINYTLGDNYIDIYQAMSKGALTTYKLKGAKDELDYLRSTIPTQKLHVFDLDNATKDSFLNLSNLAIDILHVSSHGYFNREGSREESITDLTSSLEGVTILNNCGIKLAGYNDDSESGSISATEISQMDLSQVGLVILSACETGTGDTRFGNIYSLAEAFHTAGVCNIIATTTEVEDNDAYTFFRTFMNEISSGHSYHDSFVTAQQASKSPNNYVFWE